MKISFIFFFPNCYLDTADWVHVETRQLPGLYHSDAYLVILGLQRVVPGTSRLRPTEVNIV